jgi:hypothetical protein
MLKNYDFADNTPSNGVNYYQLKQTDFDEKFTYSPVIRVSNNGSELTFSLLPNPAKDVVNIIYTGKKESVTISIYVVQGRLVKHKHSAMSCPFEKGMYVIQLTDRETLQKAKFLKE